MGSSQFSPANYWYLCALGTKLEGKRAFQEWLPQQDRGSTRWERLTQSFRHDVCISRVLLKTMSCSHFPGFVLHHGAVSGCMNWALFWVKQGWKCLRRAGGTSGHFVPGVKTRHPEGHRTKVRSSAPSTDMARVNFSLWLLLFPAPKNKAVTATWRLEDDSELILPGEHSWRLLSLWERCGWG